MSTLTLALVMLLLLLNSKRRKADQMQLFNSKLVLDMRHISIWEIDNEINSNRLKERKNDKRASTPPLFTGKNILGWKGERRLTLLLAGSCLKMVLNEEETNMNWSI
uniref:BMA-TBC-3, isoform d n=1 Tax=Brugia malayi TaxID=6279 RepID=A0A1I9G1W1_BRUMA|nr:BMA-TBC-3, isoform d [Brugia malayi]